MPEYVVNLLAIEGLRIAGEFWMAGQEPLSSVEKHRGGLSVFNLMRCVDTRPGEREQPIEIGHLSGSYPPLPQPGTARQSEGSMGCRFVLSMISGERARYAESGALSTRRKSPAGAGPVVHMSAYEA
jgi:hypothetical protein